MSLRALSLLLFASVLPGVGCRPTPVPATTANAPVGAGKLVVSCCSMPCFPGNMLGQPCDLQTLRRRFAAAAAKQGRKTGEPVCAETTTPCHSQCESPPGHLLTCAQPE